MEAHEVDQMVDQMAGDREVVEMEVHGVVEMEEAHEEVVMVEVHEVVRWVVDVVEELEDRLEDR